MKRIPLILLATLSLTACGGGDPEGLYLMTRYWSGSGSLEVASYRFADGTVVRNPMTPDGDVETEKTLHAKDVGTFEVDGDELVMNFGSESRSEMERDGDCFMWDMGTFCPAEPMDDDTLDATFSGGASAHAGGGVAIASMTIDFDDDGTYTLSSAGSVSSTGDGSSVSGGSTGGEKGEYRFDGTALYLTPAGGEERIVSTFQYDDDSDGPEPRRLYFGGTMLKRVN